MTDVRRSELFPCISYKKIKVGEMGEVMCCRNGCGGEHTWSKECWITFFATLSTCPLLTRYKGRKFYSEKNEEPFL